MNKTIIYLLILAILGSGIYFLMIRKDDNPYGASEAGFTIQDTANVTKLFLVSNSGESITAERKGAIWILNGKYKALPSMVELVLKTISRQAAVAPVTKAAYDNAIKVLSTDGIKVEVYKKGEEKPIVFYAGGASATGIGTNMLMDGAKTPYVVHEPNFTGDITARYSTRFSDWKDRTVFDIPAAQIKSVSVQYLDKPANSYVLSKETGNFLLTGKNGTPSKEALNLTRVNFYWNYFSNVNCEGYLNGLNHMDSVIKQTVKRCEVDVETIDGKKQHADIFWLPINKRSKNQQNPDKEVPDKYDADRMYAIINNNQDTVLIQTQIFRKILRTYPEFFQHDSLQKPGIQAPKRIVPKQ